MLALLQQRRHPLSSTLPTGPLRFQLQFKRQKSLSNPHNPASHSTAASKLHSQRPREMKKPQRTAKKTRTRMYVIREREKQRKTPRRKKKKNTPKKPNKKKKTKKKTSKKKK